MEGNNNRKNTIFEKKKTNLLDNEINDIEYKEEFSIGSFLIFFFKDIFLIFIFMYIIVDHTKNYESGQITKELKSRLNFELLDYQADNGNNFKNINNFNEFLNWINNNVVEGIYLEQDFINKYEKSFNVSNLINYKDSPEKILPKVDQLSYLKEYLDKLKSNCEKNNCTDLKFYQNITENLNNNNNNRINDTYIIEATNDTSTGCNNFDHKIEDNGELLSIKYRHLFERPLIFNKLFSSIRIFQKRRKLNVVKNDINFRSQEFSTEDFGNNKQFKYNSVSKGFEIHYNTYDYNLKELQDTINNLKEMKFIDNQTELLNFSFAFINANYKIICYTQIISELKDKDLFIKNYSIDCFPLFHYLTFSDKARIVFEIIYFIIFIIICLSEVLFLIQIINSIISINLMKNPCKTKFKRILYYIYDYFRVYFLKFIIGLSKYIYKRFTKFILIICNFLALHYWNKFNQFGDLVSALNFNDPNLFKTPQYFNLHTNLEFSLVYLSDYRYVTSIIFLIYIIDFFNIIFLFSNYFKNFYKIIIKALKNNLYFLVFFFCLSYAFALFIHFFFGDAIENFSSVVKSMTIIFGTILGFKEGLTKLVEKSPIIATIAIEIYFFLIIMILVNMFIIIVNAEYRYNDLIIQQKENLKNKKRSKFDYVPFIYYNIKEQIITFFTKTIYKYINKNKWRKIKEIEKLKNLNDRVKYSELEKLDFDKDFVSYKKYNSNILLENFNSKNSSEEINNYLIEKEVKFIWKFCLYFTLFLIQIIIIYILYLPLQEDYEIFENKIYNSLKKFDKFNAIETVPFNDFVMRSTYLDLMSQILNKRTDFNFRYKIENISIRNELTLLGDIIVKIENNKIYTLTYENFKPIINYDYININNFFQNKVISNEKPIHFKETEILYTKTNLNGKVILNFCPKIDYLFQENNLIALIDNKIDFVKPYILKLILDKAIGPQTNNLSTILIFLHNKHNIYIRVKITYAKTFGDVYYYQYDYNQIKNTNSILILTILFILMIFKTINLLVIIIKIIKNIIYSNYEYNIWYNIEIKNSLSNILIGHRNRKKPEFMRKIKHILKYDYIIGIIEFILFLVFWIIFILYLINFSELENLQKLVNTDPKKYSLLLDNQFNLVDNYTFYIYLISGIENFLHCNSIILSLKNIKYFEVVIESLRNIFTKLLIVIIIMIMFILAFSFTVFYLIGYKEEFFKNFYNIENFTSILVSFNDFSLYSDNYNSFLIFIFVIPYFIIIKFTVLFVIIGIIYASVNQAEINIKKHKKGIKINLTLKKFINISIKNFKKFYYKSLNYNNNKLNKFFSQMNITIRTDNFDKIYEKYNFINNQQDPTFWSNSMGKLIVNEIKERKLIIKKFKNIENCHIFHLIEFKDNFFIKNFDNKEIYKIYEFISLFFSYFNQGYNKIIYLIEKESKENELLKIRVIRENIDEKKINTLKNKIIELEKKLEKSIKNNQLANEALNKIEIAPNGTNLSELLNFNN